MTVSTQNLLHCLAVFLPNLLFRVCGFGVQLQSPEEPQWCIHGVVGRVLTTSDVREQSLFHVFDHGVHDLFAQFRLAKGQSQTRQRDESVAAPAPEPGIACNDLRLAVALDDELLRSVLQTVEERRTGSVVTDILLV